MGSGRRRYFSGSRRFAGFRNFAGFDATGANFHTFRATLLELDPDRLQIGIEAARCSVVSVRDIVPELGRLSADFASFGHNDYLRGDWRPNRLPVSYSSVLPCNSKRELIANSFPHGQAGKPARNDSGTNV
jgi:hypothetical protein